MLTEVVIVSGLLDNFVTDVQKIERNVKGYSINFRLFDAYTYCFQRCNVCHFFTKPVWYKGTVISAKCLIKDIKYLFILL